jgi:flagellar capping protein FliD
MSNGTTFAIDKQTQTIVLQQKFMLSLPTSDHFEDNLSVFVDAWNKRIDEICSETEMLVDEDIKITSKEKQYGSWKN